MTRLQNIISALNLARELIAEEGAITTAPDQDWVLKDLEEDIDNILATLELTFPAASAVGETNAQ